MAAAASFRTCSTAVCACTAAGPDSSPGSSGRAHATVNAGSTLPTHTRPPGRCAGLAGNARPTISARRAALSIFGKMPAELLGKKPWDVYPSSVGAALDLGCRRAMAERLVVTTQYGFASQRWHSVVVMPDSRGGICLRFSEISEPKLMEDPLQKSEEEFYTVFRCCPYPLGVFDMGTHCVLDVNDTFERESGYRRDEVVGRTDEVWLAMDAKADSHLRVMGRNIRFLKSDLESFRATFKQEVGIAKIE